MSGEVMDSKGNSSTSIAVMGYTDSSSKHRKLTCVGRSQSDGCKDGVRRS